jgi:hypothetical protein
MASRLSSCLKTEAYRPECIASGRAGSLAAFQPWRGIRVKFQRIGDTMISMVLALICMKILEVMFFVGLAGSSIVVLISFIEDGKELFGKDE